MFSPIQFLGIFENNQLYVKREDMIPYSFGGNKARKAYSFFREIDKGKYDCVVTYGTTHSNHCRIVANMAAQRSMPCYIIGPLEVSDTTFNSELMNRFGAHIIQVPLNEVHDSIDRLLDSLKKEGRKPYFIPGGGHGNIGTKAYVECYKEISDFETTSKVHFDYIFFASGTGGTQAGIVCGKMMQNDIRNIIGISIARTKSRAEKVIIEAIKDFLPDYEEEKIQKEVVVLDDYVGDGYGIENLEIKKVIDHALIDYGMPLDSTYTGKAFWGMKQYLKKNEIANSRVLFIHTGGLPLFFDYLRG